MSNSYFQFKQFTIHQHDVAMKVSTDACIQGAWTTVDSSVKNVLDIGTGTGLLSLMLAQRYRYLNIDAMEVDEKAARQAKRNISASGWRNINIIHGDVRNYQFEKKYDMVICNPPFFRNSLKSPAAERNLARHDLTLSYEDLPGIFNRVLTQAGYASVLLPYTEQAKWEQLLSDNGWHTIHKLVVRPRLSLQPNRIVSLCSRDNSQRPKAETLCIYEEDQSYTADFKSLMSPFYLYL